MDSQAVAIEGAHLTLRREAWDCEILGIEAGKLEEATADTPAAALALVARTLDVAKERGFEHLASRISTSDRAFIRAYTANAFELVDTVVHIQLDRARFLPTGERHSAIRMAHAADADAIAALSADAFATPGESHNRYANDGRFSVEQVRSVYAKWGRTSVGGPAADLVFCISAGLGIAGFLTLKKADAKGVARVMLNAVSPSQRGRGVYRELVEHAATVAFDAGASALAVTTQLQQTAVQRVWWRLGATIVGSSHSFHRWL